LFDLAADELPESTLALFRLCVADVGAQVVRSAEV
jgi:hypothetical protein